MNVGEVARFVIAPQYGYGSEGFAPKVEPDETLDFEIELIRFKVCSAVIQSPVAGVPSAN
ncbi:hypothetical protein BBJ28_00022754 [Nothophytophthora sp. Chile5]|nr:hypothetical protein BBJ28_00022754 [Nothophytophthora sp. Chile5]